jgi:ADP-heptose:LPS heptosyltransferase
MMSFSKAINEVRRVLTQKLTKKIATSNLNYAFDSTNKPVIKTILISRPNKRLGNLLLITPLVQDVVATFPDSKIDLLVKGSVAPIVFKNYENIDQIIQLPNKPFKQLLPYIKCLKTIKNKRYDLVINVDKNSSSGRLSTKYSNSKFKFFGDFDEEILLTNKEYHHIAKYPIYSYRNNLSQLGFGVNDKPIPPLHLNLSPLEKEEGKKMLHQLVANDKKTIGLFTYATGEKCLSESWWEEYYQKLKITYSNYNIIEVLPFENVSKIAFKAPSFYSKSIREIGSVISNTELFIGADSGIMHLASSVQIPTIGLFSVTDFNLNKYKPYSNGSVGVNTNENSVDEILEVVHTILN